MEWENNTAGSSPALATNTTGREAGASLDPVGAKTMPAWEIRWSRTRELPYFFNTETKTSSWNEPDGLSKEAIQQLPGAEYLSKDRPHAHPEQGRTGDPAGKVHALHLLVKHRGSRHPSSWKEKIITRTKEEAITMLREYQAQLDGSQDTFSKLAKEYSDCSSHENGGDLGSFGYKAMQEPFAAAAFALQIGEVSDIVLTDSGVHLILRIG